MTDHIEVLRGMCDELLAAYSHEMAIDNPKCAADYKARADALTFALSAREGGEADRRAEILRHERDHARACYENAVRILTGIHAVIYPQIVEMADGRKFAFNSPLLHEQMQALSDRIRAIPEELALHPAQPASQQGEISEARVEAALAVLGLRADRKDDVRAALRVAGAAHPTGDRVRGLVEKWRAEAMDYEPGPDSTGPDRELLRRCDELAAALDQEKGR
jgi:hypothetical protein